MAYPMLSLKSLPCFIKSMLRHFTAFTEITPWPRGLNFLAIWTLEGGRRWLLKSSSSALFCRLRIWNVFAGHRHSTSFVTARDRGGVPTGEPSTGLTKPHPFSFPWTSFFGVRTMSSFTTRLPRFLSAWCDILWLFLCEISLMKKIDLSVLKGSAQKKPYKIVYHYI